MVPRTLPVTGSEDAPLQSLCPHRAFGSSLFLPKTILEGLQIVAETDGAGET